MKQCEEIGCKQRVRGQCVRTGTLHPLMFISVFSSGINKNTTASQKARAPRMRPSVVNEHGQHGGAAVSPVP